MRPRENEPCGFAVERHSVELVLAGPMRIQGVRTSGRMVWMMAYLVWLSGAASSAKTVPAEVMAGCRIVDSGRS